MASPSLPSIQQLEVGNQLVYHSLASATFIIWNYCLSLHQELDFVWRSEKQWTLINVLFYILRYVSLGQAILDMVYHTNLTGLIHRSTTLCNAWVWFIAVAGPILLCAIELLIIMRVYAIYGRSRLLLYSLLMLLACHVSAQSVLVGLVVPEMVVVPSPFPPNLHLGECVFINIPPTFSFLWLPTIITESILFVFVAMKAIQVKPWKLRKNCDLLAVIVRDGSWVFLCVLAISLWSFLAYNKGSTTGHSALSWAFSLVGYCGTQLILNLRSEAIKRSAAAPDTQLGLTFLSDFAVVEIPDSVDRLSGSSTEAE